MCPGRLLVYGGRASGGPSGNLHCNASPVSPWGVAQVPRRQRASMSPKPRLHGNAPYGMPHRLTATNVRLHRVLP